MKQRLMRALLCVNLVLGGISLVHASALNDLKQLSSTIKSLSGDFTQRTQQNGAVVTYQGTFLYQKPNQFLWHVLKPSEQVVLSDGQHLTQYDPELEQLTRRPLDPQMTDSFFTLLLDPVKLADNYTLTEVSVNEHPELAWVQLHAKSETSSFTQMLVGFAQGLPQELQVTDGFGQVSIVSLQSIKVNPALNANAFTFNPPAGTTVLELGAE